MRTRRFTRLPGMTLAVMLSLLVGQAPVFGHDDREGWEHRTLGDFRKRSYYARVGMLR
jgi:hypothetical protein